MIRFLAGFISGRKKGAVSSIPGPYARQLILIFRQGEKDGLLDVSSLCSRMLSDTVSIRVRPRKCTNTSSVTPDAPERAQRISTLR